MTKLLSEDAVAAYRRDGYYFPVDILSEAETRALRDKLEVHERESGGPIQGDRRHKPHLYLTFLNDLVHHPRILDAVEDVLGPNLLCWSTSFFIKEPSDPGFVSWHQDATYWGLSSPDVMTVWVAFTPANLLNGCMKFMPGSHRQQLEHNDTFDKHNLLSRGQEIAVKVDESKGVDAILNPGQASLHHVLLAHGSEPNKSADRRIGFAIRYIPTHVRQAVGARDSATLVRGTDSYNYFEHEPRPTADCTPEALALHAGIVGRQVQVLYRGTGQEHFPAITTMDERKAYRIGIDVGGTFTKAVLVDDDTHEIVGRYSTLTTHAGERGVAEGVVEVFRRVLEGSRVAPEDVVFLAHSTTQATNALLEGDVARFGIVAIASGPAAALAAKQSRIDGIELAPGRTLHPGHRFIKGEALNEAAAAEAVRALQEEGAKVIVATSAFGVDDGSDEEAIRDAATALGLPVTCGHEISKLYGLATRTRTAVINASILPRMIETADMTQQSVREAGIAAPLMIMRGDGGVMDVNEMRRRPAMTMLSGPAASVAGALMHLRISDGIYFEVGGTSTNIGVIRNGRPTVKYARVGGHETYVSSLDVRVLGIAGGSLVRVADGKLVDVGPRSAHIAGLAYSAFASPEVFDGATVELFQPGPGEAADHVAIRCRDGARYAITTTCAANALGYARPGMHAFGNPDAARAAIAPLAALLGGSVEDAARQILERATDKVMPVVKQLVAEYGLDHDQSMLVGEGGGAGALMPFAAGRLGLRHVISPDAEVISSIGVALALVREVVERVIADPTPEDLRAIRREALDAVVRLGAAAETVEVTIEIDAHSQRVRATAVGASEMRARGHRKRLGEAEARAVAAESMGVPVGGTSVTGATDGMRLIQARINGRHSLRAVDLDGAIRIQRSNAAVERAHASDALAALQAQWKETHEMFLVLGTHVIDLSGIAGRDQAMAVARTELDGVPADTTVLLVAARK